jgi:hypothetical protein
MPTQMATHIGINASLMACTTRLKAAGADEQIGLSAYVRDDRSLGR